MRLTPELRQAVLTAVGQGMRRTAALVLAGISSGTAVRWLGIGDGRYTSWNDGSPVTESTVAFLRALSSDFERAEATRELTTLSNIAKAAETVNEKTGIPEWRAGAWLLEHGPAWKRDYAEYREQRIEHAGTVDHEHRLIQQLPKADILELAGPEFADLVPPT